MYNSMVYDTTTGKIINAVSTPNEGVTPVVGTGQTILPISDADFENILNQISTYYNTQTSTLEPTAIKKVSLITQPPYNLGNITLQFQQQSLDGTPIIDNCAFNVNINGVSQQVSGQNGNVQIQLNYNATTIVVIEISSDRYQTYSTSINIG